MPTLAADFGIILAYVIPGFLCLWAASWLSDRLGRLFHTAREGEKRVFELFALTAMALAVGMLVSIMRAGTIDETFKWPVPFCDPSDCPQCGSVARVDPEIEALICEQSREAFLVVEAREKRPYQFYGNMALSALFIAVAASLRDRGRMSRSRWIGGALLLVFVAGTFYAGARLSHYRFMRAVDCLNDLGCAGQSRSECQMR